MSNLAAAVDADGRSDTLIAVACWPSVLKAPAAALTALNRALDGAGLTVSSSGGMHMGNIERLAIGLCVSVDAITSVHRAEARGREDGS